MRRPRLRSTSFMLLIILLAAGAGVGGYFETRAIRLHHYVPPVAAGQTPAALVQVTAVPAQPVAGPAGAMPTRAAVTAALKSAVAAPSLGTRLRARVIDAATGAVLYDRDGANVAAPASTAKILTATAVLSVRAPTDRISTTVVAGPVRTVVVVGGGDPTLTGAAAGQPGAYPDAARISDLAAQLTKSRIPISRIVVDSTLFTGPAISPNWVPGDVPSDYASAITALLSDGGRDTPHAVVRSVEPDLAAGHELAAALGRPDLPVTRGRATPGAAELARVQSAPIAELVGQMLAASDNVIAECLARQVAIATHQPVSFTGAAAGIRAELADLGVQIGGGLSDGSGLSASDRVSPAALAQVLALTVSDRHPATRAAITGLPVAGWSGTLSNRFLSTSTGVGAAGVVRAKTGTLTSVSSLAGFVHDTSGRLLIFAFIADQVQPGVDATDNAELALDIIAAKLAKCGCA